MTLENQRTLQWLKHIEVKVYRGLHLNAGNTDTSIVDQWIERKTEPFTDLERLLNHVHIYDYFPTVQDEKELESLASEIALDWEKTLSKRDPRYRVVKYEGYGPEVTFYFDRNMSDAE